MSNVYLFGCFSRTARGFREESMIILVIIRTVHFIIIIKYIFCDSMMAISFTVVKEVLQNIYTIHY